MTNPTPTGDHFPAQTYGSEQPSQWSGNTTPAYDAPPQYQPYPPQYQPYQQPYQPAGAPPYPGYPPQYVPGMNPTNSLAIASFVCSIAGIFVTGLGLVGIILGHIALGQIKRSNGYERGHGFAVAGLIIGYVWLGLAVLIIIGFLLLVVFVAPSSPSSFPAN